MKRRPTEIVGFPLPAEGWASAVLGDLRRFKSMVVGPGLGRAEHTIAAVHDVVAGAEIPLVLDGDGLFAVARDLEVVRRRRHPTVLTPHDGEYELLAGHPPADDRLDAARSLAAETGAVVLLKGATTVVADVEGHVLVTNQGDTRGSPRQARVTCLPGRSARSSPWGCRPHEPPPPAPSCTVARAP